MDDVRPEPPAARRAEGPTAPRAGVPAEPAVPAVVARDRQELAARARRRGWKRSGPSLAVALLLHGLLGFWLHTQLVAPLLEDAGRTVRADTLDADEVEELVDEPEPEVELEPPPEPLADVLPEPDVYETTSSDEVLGLGARSMGGGRFDRQSVSANVGDAGSFGFADASGAEFQEFVSDLRARGVDVVFVIDATGSMQRFIDRAREAIDDIIGDISRVVPDLRFGMVAYRDLQDDWVTRHIDLTRDRYAVQTFLLDLTAAGGKRDTPDFEEAVEVGLALAKDGLSWRDDARRVILLVGDAPYHEEDKAAALATVRSFARDPQSVVHTVYVGAGDPASPTRNQGRARDAWDDIARTGGGTAFALQTETPEADAELRRQVVEATFGKQWQEQVATFLARAPFDPRLFSVQRHVERGDRKWLARRLYDESLHPAVVEAAMTMFDPVVARTCLAMLNDPLAPAEGRSAALYVLKRRIAALEGVPFDTNLPNAEQGAALSVIKREVERLGPGKPAGRSVTPPPELPGGR